MNRWFEIWEKRSKDIDIEDDVFNTFIKLKKADGFDIQQQDGYYESFYEQFSKSLTILDEMLSSSDDINSVFEVGCGSGVNLYLFNHLCKVNNLGGIDYSANLIDIARRVVDSDDITCNQALSLDTNKKYDLVMSDSVFQYFQDEEYGYSVLEKMYDKATKAIVIKELHDKACQEEHLRLRRATVENYDEKYAGLDKTFYSKDRFIEFAKKHGCEYRIVQPDNDAYWNNQFVFDFYMIKKQEV